MIGLGEMRALMVSSFVCFFIVSLPLSWLFGVYFQWGLVGIWSSFSIPLTLAGIIYYWVYRRKLKGR